MNLKNVLKEIEKTLPIELLKIISDFHHCKECFREDKIKKKYCLICEEKKFFYIYKVCPKCDDLLNDDKSSLINKDFKYNKYCNNCNAELLKLLYCKQIEKCNLQYSIFFKKFKCKTCNIENIVM